MSGLRTVLGGVAPCAVGVEADSPDWGAAGEGVAGGLESAEAARAKQTIAKVDATLIAARRRSLIERPDGGASAAG
jgi:hypothetical protein